MKKDIPADPCNIIGEKVKGFRLARVRKDVFFVESVSSFRFIPPTLLSFYSRLRFNSPLYWILLCPIFLCSSLRLFPSFPFFFLHHLQYIVPERKPAAIKREPGLRYDVLRKNDLITMFRFSELHLAAPPPVGAPGIPENWVIDSRRNFKLLHVVSFRGPPRALHSISSFFAPR